MARLKMLRGPTPGAEFALEADLIKIGRGRTNDIIIQDNEVSRYHCRLVRVLEDYELHDMQSTNGTFVSGQRVDARGWVLSSRFIIELGDSITLEYIPNLSSDTGKLGPGGMMAPGDAQAFYLVVKNEDLPNPEIYLLDRVTLAIGRDVDNDIVTRSVEVSRHHLRLAMTENGYVIEDLNTLNGTRVNGRKLVRPRLLSGGDTIEIGTKLRIWYTDTPDQIIQLIKTHQQTDAMFDDGETHRGNPLQTRPLAPLTESERPTGTGETGILASDPLEDYAFIAYAREDWNALVKSLNTYLNEHHIKTWIEQHLTPQSEEWEAGIESALGSGCLVVIISEHSLKVPYVLRSVRHFLAREKPVLLLRYGKIVQEPVMIANLPAIELDPTDPMRAFRVLLAELRKLTLRG